MCGQEWRILYALTRELFWCLLPEFSSNKGNKHQNNQITLGTLMTSAAADVINHNGRKIGQTVMILLGKHAYFGLNFCINITLNPI